MQDARILPPDEETAAEADRIATEALQAQKQAETEAAEKARVEAEAAASSEELRRAAIALARAAAQGEISTDEGDAPAEEEGDFLPEDMAEDGADDEENAFPETGAHTENAGDMAKQPQPENDAEDAGYASEETPDDAAVQNPGDMTEQWGEAAARDATEADYASDDRGLTDEEADAQSIDENMTRQWSGETAAEENAAAAGIGADALNPEEDMAEKADGETQAAVAPGDEEGDFLSEDTAEDSADDEENASGETDTQRGLDALNPEEDITEQPQAEDDAEWTDEAEDVADKTADAAEAAPEPKKGFFARLREGLRKTKDALLSRIQGLFNSFTKIDDEFFDALEETLVLSDLGPVTSEEICDMLRVRVKERGVTDPQEITQMLQDILVEMLGEDEAISYPTKPTVLMVIGVNGSGKTTTIGKLSYQLKKEGKKVVVAAADTFRAAAIDQLEVWTERAGATIVKHEEGSDPGSVLYDAIALAKSRGADVLICDTAGRLHNKKNLMQELAKMNRIVANQAAGCHVEILLVLDATTGQNAVNQARLFGEVAPITGIVLTKLDGTAKGGIVVAIRNELHIPVKLIGVGEKIEDLQPFRAREFVAALF